MKKIFLLALITLSVFLGIFLSSSIPEIYGLKDGYVRVHVEDDRVRYTVTKERPKNWVSLDELGTKKFMVFVISEDWSFFEHPGLDISQIKKAIIEAYRNERYRGASTISQQLVKNLFTSGERTIYRKFKELILTLLIEKNLSKQKILETYINIIQYGKNLYGIEPAAEFYFGTRAKNLSLKEVSFLVMLLPSPVRYAQSYHDRVLTDYAEEIISSILHKLVVAKVITKQEQAILMNEPIIFNPNLFSF